MAQASPSLRDGHKDQDQHQRRREARKTLRRARCDFEAWAMKNVESHYKSLSSEKESFRHYKDLHKCIDPEQKTFIRELCDWYPSSNPSDSFWRLKNGDPIVLQDHLFETILSFLRALKLPDTKGKYTKELNTQYARDRTAGVRTHDVRMAIKS